MPILYIWGQNLDAVSRIVIHTKDNSYCYPKALRIMNFQSRGTHSSPLFKSNHSNQI